MSERRHYIYILTNRTHQTLYIGMTCDLRRRLEEHRRGDSSFTNAYSMRKPVYFEVHDEVLVAKQREKTMKHRIRAWKDDLVSSANPEWLDLTDQIPFD